ncbi:hypothetical protein QVD17_38573 [Tagetes erecta]|uniref:Uncharacterized protein n=1 Tax=Tagetes erecta TaxID=13708 RepID=A0AAD8JP51_TARER|nr:hypothetical protein QVD17_38573 [Tagetes erecta]
MSAGCVSVARLNFKLEHVFYTSCEQIKGYNLFTNTITTTDLHYDIINGDNLTFFTPTDSSLYALDMSLSAADYTNSVPTLVPVHGLEGVMDFRSLRDAINSSSVAVNLTEDHTPMNAMNDHHVSMAHRIYVTRAQKYHQSETALKSIPQQRSPVAKSESIVQPRLPDTRSESITQPRPVTYSESIDDGGGGGGIWNLWKRREWRKFE